MVYMICYATRHGIRNLSYNPAWYNKSVIQPLLLSLSIVVVVVVVVVIVVVVTTNLL